MNNLPQTSRMGSKGPLVILTFLFFMWGFITCLNDILIPHFKTNFQLSFFQSSLVQFSFFGAYFIGSLVYFFISSSSGDPINRIGYRNGIIAGLLLACTGTLLFYPAASLGSYAWFLTGLFVLGLGFTLLQIAANPYVTIIGPAQTASHRLNFAQAFNSLGTTIAPIIGGAVILDAAGAELTSVRVPYLIFSAMFILLVVIFRFAHLPKFTREEETVKGMPALKYPQLVYGIIAIFFYVGGEVTTGSYLTSYAGSPEMGGWPASEATVFVALYWGSLMIGRFTGSVQLFATSPNRRNVLTILVPFLTFGLILLMIRAKGQDISHLYPYTACLVPGIIAFRLSNFRPERMLMLFSGISVLLLMLALNTTGRLSLFSIVSLGLYNSIMWPVIFSLAITGLGKHTGQGSSLLVMAILGGALLPPVQGWIADLKGIHFSYIVPVFCYFYLFFYGWKVKRILKLTDH